MFENPLMFDELELLYKGDATKRIIFYHQVKYQNPNLFTVHELNNFAARGYKRRWRGHEFFEECKENTKEHSCHEPSHKEQRQSSRWDKQLLIFIQLIFLYLGKKKLFTTDGSECSMTGLSIYFMRSTMKKNLSEETFQVLLFKNLCLNFSKNL